MSEVAKGPICCTQSFNGYACEKPCGHAGQCHGKKGNRFELTWWGANPMPKPHRFGDRPMTDEEVAVAELIFGEFG